MANFVYTKAKANLLSGDIDLDADDIRVMLVTSTTTADTEEDTTFIDQFATLGEFTDGSYSRKALAGEVVNTDNTNNRGEFDADDVTWSSLTGDTAQAAVVFKFVTNDAASIPICYIDTGGFPFTANGGDLTLSWNVEGILQAT